MERSQEKSFVLASATLVGWKHHDWKNRFQEIGPDTKMWLKAEPENTYDKFAVMVVDKEGKQIGYIPRDNRIISRLVQGGYELQAVTAKNWDHQMPILHIIMERKQKV